MSPAAALRRRERQCAERSHLPCHTFAFGHFSRFIKPGAKRIIAASDDDNLLSTAFLNPDGKAAVVVLNTGTNETKLRLSTENKAARTVMPAQSIMTFVFDK